MAIQAAEQMNYRRNAGGLFGPLVICILLPGLAAYAGYMFGLRTSQNELVSPPIEVTAPEVTVNVPPVSMSVGTDELGLVLSRIENRCAEMTAAMKMANTTSLQFAYITWEIEQLETRDQKIEKKKLLLLKIPKERRTQEQSDILDSLVESQNKNYVRLNSRRNLLLQLVTKLEQQVMRKESEQSPPTAGKVLVKPTHQPNPRMAAPAEHANDDDKRE